MTDEYIDQTNEEVEDSYTNDDIYNINSWGADLSFRELITMYDEDELIKPELQRNYVWDKVEASRFIDSLLLGLPVPSVFLANTYDDRKLIIDGYQRIMTVYDYVKGIWSKDERIFRLSNSEKINERWRNKAFSELSSDEQRKIRSTTIHAIVFEQIRPKTNDTSLYQIFERINTGGRALMAQEIRNCVYQGRLNSLLFVLNDSVDWRILFGAEKDSRMRDMEFALRFLALQTSEIMNHPKGNISLKKLLNEFMGFEANNSEAYITNASNNFLTTMRFIRQHIGENAFFNIVSGEPTRIRKRFYPTIFDAISIATSIAIERCGSQLNTSELEARRLSLLQNDDFRSYITEGTMQAESIQGRIKYALRYLYDIEY